MYVPEKVPSHVASAENSGPRSVPATVPSSVIQSFAYDKEDCRLIVRFVGGKVYTYEDVPGDVAAGLGTAASKGSYFNDVIRDRFPFARMR